MFDLFLTFCRPLPVIWSFWNCRHLVSPLGPICVWFLPGFTIIWSRLSVNMWPATPPHPSPGEEAKSLEGGDKAGICFLEMHITAAMEGRRELYILKGKASTAFTVFPIEPMFGIIKWMWSKQMSVAIKWTGINAIHKDQRQNIKYTTIQYIVEERQSICFSISDILDKLEGLLGQRVRVAN